MDARSLETLAELLLEWEDRFRQGEDLPVEVLAREHPDLESALEARIRILKLARWLDEPGEGAERSEEGDQAVDADLPDGLLAARYRLDRRLATGGFAEVWLAHDDQLDRTVAIKLPKATRVYSAAAVLAEARRVARLSHPHILPIHDVSVEKETCFIVSDYLDGGSLADRLADGTVPRASAIRLIGQVAEALAFAHGQGVIHRDVKPGNIFLNSRGDAVLGDFGIARMGTVDEAEAPLGTLRYMAPEQLAGEPCTPRSDIYSLGVVLHEALSGESPYEATDPGSLHRAISGGGVRISSAIPKPLAMVCRTALSHAPEERHASATEFLADLRRAESRQGRTWSRALVAPAIGLAAVPLVLLFAPRSGTIESNPASPQTFVAPGPAIDLAIQPSGLVPMLRPQGAPPTVRLECWTVGETLPYVVEAVNLRQYREWQDPPLTYFGPRLDGVEGKLVYRFDFPAPVSAATARFETFCVNFLEEPGGEGRGASSLEVSPDGQAWHTIFDHLGPPQWGRRWSLIDEPLPDVIQGSRSIWLRVRFLTSGCPNDDYTVAQVGRPRPGGQHPAFRLVVELEPAAD